MWENVQTREIPVGNCVVVFEYKIERYGNSHHPLIRHMIKERSYGYHVKGRGISAAFRPTLPLKLWGYAPTPRGSFDKYCDEIISRAEAGKLWR